MVKKTLLPVIAGLERRLAAAVEPLGWRLHRSETGSGTEETIFLDAEGNRWVVVLKVISEGRADRLIPLLAQAILEAEASARRIQEPVTPLAIVGARHVSRGTAELARVFWRDHAPHAAFGVMDSRGLRLFGGRPLERLNSTPPRRQRRSASSPAGLPSLFSDLNRWMLKILLGQLLPEALIKVPRTDFSSAAELAEAAGVSTMTASRLIRKLEAEGFLGEDADRLHLVRVDDLLARWAAANRDAFEERKLRWVIKRDSEHLKATLRSQHSRQVEKERPDPPVMIADGGGAGFRSCLGLFAAADALGLGIVRGVPPHLYMDRMRQDVLTKMGFRTADTGERPDVIIRVPKQPESIFRAMVVKDGLPVADVLQVWLDVSTHPSRGREQASVLKRRVLSPAFGGN